MYCFCKLRARLGMIRGVMRRCYSRRRIGYMHYKNYIRCRENKNTKNIQHLLKTIHFNIKCIVFDKLCIFVFPTFVSNEADVVGVYGIAEYKLKRPWRLDKFCLLQSNHNYYRNSIFSFTRNYHFLSELLCVDVN